MSTPPVCPNCLQHPLHGFYTVDPVPVHSVLLVPTRAEALAFPSGTITLGACYGCGFISNSSFDEAKMSYSPKCEETQGFSGTFQTFHRRLAADLIERCDLRNKTLLEIGCGKGEFIAMLCAMGGNRGIGFDPAFVPQRVPEEGGDAVEFIADFYSERYAHVKADFIACKMTLEHIPHTLAFVSMVRRAIGDNPGVTVFFQVPDMTRVLEDIAFWDVYHEHCSYFTATALQNLFTLAGFELLETWTDYDGQYLMITARPADQSAASNAVLLAPSPAELAATRTFAEQAAQRIHMWRDTVTCLRDRGESAGTSNARGAAIWGSGSKGVAFLSAIGADIDDRDVTCAVDINPYRKGYFMPGTGQPIVEPGFLVEHPPLAVIAMNSIYLEEIRAVMNDLGVRVPLLPIDTATVIA